MTWSASARSKGCRSTGPSQFPRSGLLAARVASAAEGERWRPEFIRAVYRANFAYDRDITDRVVIGELLQELGLPAMVWLEHARPSLRARTEEAPRCGIFGAPSFLVSDELFWGNDRLEYALDWAEHHAP